MTKAIHEQPRKDGDPPEHQQQSEQQQPPQTQQQQQGKQQATPLIDPTATVGTVHSLTEPCGLETLVSEARTIAAGVRTIASELSKIHFSHVWPYLAALIAALFATETFLQHQQETARNQADALFSSTRDQLASSSAAIRANAVRSLPPLAEFQSIVQSEPRKYFVGSYLVNRFCLRRFEQPLKSQCWMLFREFAQQLRMQQLTSADEVDVVSSALLQEGVAWEKRIRFDKSSRTLEMSGSLLFGAKLANAKGIGLDCSDMNFGPTDLKFANVASSNFDDASLLRASLEGALLNNTSFKSACLAEANLTKADLSFGKCPDADFRKARLRSVTFKQTVLTRANFSGADLDSCFFTQANIADANFSGASLRGTVFSQTDVSTASFNGADVENVDFTSAFGVSKTLLANAKNFDKAVVGPEEQKNTFKNP